MGTPEYMKKYNARPAQKKRRAARGRARYDMEKKHGKSALKGKDVHHRDKNPNNNSKSNLAISSIKKNRASNRKR